jgi:hypothetical protein
MDSYMASNGIMFHGHLDYLQKSPLGDRSNTKPGDHGITTLTIVDLFYIIICEEKFIEIAFS